MRVPGGYQCYAAGVRLSHLIGKYADAEFRMYCVLARKFSWLTNIRYYGFPTRSLQEQFCYLPLSAARVPVGIAVNSAMWEDPVQLSWFSGF